MDTDEMAREIAQRGDGSMTPLSEEAEGLIEGGADVGPKYPKVHAYLTGGDGNGFVVASTVRKAIESSYGEDDDQFETRQAAREAGRAYFDEALASTSYDALLQHAMATVHCS